MLFKICDDSKTLSLVQSNWLPKELQLEAHLISTSDDGAQLLSAEVFGEQLLLIRKQAATSSKKRADILALDRGGNAVIIELKRDGGRLGVETQALQYLADFSAYTGANFLKKFCHDPKLNEAVLGFLGDLDIEEINKHPRIILMARSFDEAVFSIGEWLSSKGVPFRCISYNPVEIAGIKLISFSVAFDRSTGSLYSLTFTTNTREPGIFWHNIGAPDDEWWQYLVDRGQITTGFENAPGDQGEKILTRYIAGDSIVAYARGYGAIGWGTITNPGSYRLIPEGSKDDVRISGRKHLHRLDINWKAAAKKLTEGLSAESIRQDFQIYHPVSTSASMDYQRGTKLIERLSERFGTAAKSK